MMCVLCCVKKISGTACTEEENDRIEKDAEVEIIAVKGVKLIVKMKG